MLRVVATRAVSGLRQSIARPVAVSSQQVRNGHGKVETDEEFDARYEKFFNRPDIDHWEIRKAFNDLAGKFFFCIPSASSCHNHKIY